VAPWEVRGLYRKSGGFMGGEVAQWEVRWLYRNLADLRGSQRGTMESKVAQ
jgi:hypothetical protein